jgi:hypothetical protein
MQIHDLVKTIDKMTNEELLEHVRAMRHRREVARPVARQKVERAEKKATVAKAKKGDKLLASLTPEQLIELLQGMDQ